MTPNWSVGLTSDPVRAPGPPCAACATAPPVRAYPPPVRRSRGARIRHVAARVAEAAAVLALLAVVAFAARLANGPIYLQSVHDKIASSLQERIGYRYAIDLGPTYLTHDSFGVGLGFRRLTVRDVAGRTVLAAPAGKIGLDIAALFAASVKVRRLELDGLDLRLRVAADGALSIAVSGDESAAPIALPERRVWPRKPQSRRAGPRQRGGDGRGWTGDRPADAGQRALRDRQRGDAPVCDLQGLQSRLRSVRRRGDRQPLGLRGVRAVDDREPRRASATRHARRSKPTI